MKTKTEVKNWREFVLPWGKREGWTMFQVYKNDYDYAVWLAQKSSDEAVRSAAQAAVDHKANVDPYSQF